MKDPKADQSVATTWSPRVGDDDEVSLDSLPLQSINFDSIRVFERNIKIVNSEQNLERAVAALDTQCKRRNWISPRLVERIGNQAQCRKNLDRLES
jgi:hypothetical protein